MRLIDADRLLERLIKNLEYFEMVISDKGRGIAFGTSLAIDRVNEQPTIAPESLRPQWIPVEERLPDNDRYVLLSFKNYSLPLVGRCETDEEGSAFYIGDETVSCSKMGVFVNAWMELPERYVGGIG